MIWCDNAVFYLPLTYALCTSEEDYLKAVGYMQVTDPNPWLLDRADGTAHVFEGQDGKFSVIVCMRESDDVQKVVGLLAHEAVHIWQKVRELLRESQPSTEFEAYAIQQIVMNLHDKYYEERDAGSDRSVSVLEASAFSV